MQYHRVKLNQLKFVHPTLRAIMDDILEEFGPQDISSIYRMNDPGVHGTLPVRGIDISSENEQADYKKVNYVNDRWSYDYTRPWMCCAVRHDVGNGMHIHLQVHPLTKRNPY